MKVEIKIPPLGESVMEATIARIIKPNNSYIHENEEIVEIETEKINQVLYAQNEGIVTWNVQEKDTVVIGQVVGFIDTEAQEVEKEKKETPKIQTKEKFSQESKKAEPSQEQEAPSREAFQEVSKAVEVSKSEKNKRETRRPMTKIRKVIAARLIDALHNSAMLTTFNEVDMSSVIDLRERNQTRFQEKYGIKLGFMPFFVKAVVDALKEFPDFNSYIVGEEIVHREYYDIGIAVGTEKGLVVPVVRNCDQLTLAQVEKEIKEYANKARSGKLSIQDLEGGGFTITNGGVYGSLLSTPILNPPQCGILGMHKISKRAVVIEDRIEIRSMMYLALSYDHRLVDGKEAVSFLVRIKEILEDTSQLFI